MSMHWPASSSDLRRAGWQFAGWGECRACHRRIAWAKTASARLTPLNAATAAQPQGSLFCGPRYEFTPHFADCPAAAKFRRPKCRRHGNAIVCFR